MSNFSRAKGRDGELEVLGILSSRGFRAWRNDQRWTGGRNNPDVDAEGLERYHLEVKRVEDLALGKAMAQAVRDADGKRIPAVVHRKNRGSWFISFRFEDWLADVGGEELEF